MEIIKVRKKNHAYLHVEASPSVMNEITDFFTFFANNYKFDPRYKKKHWDGKIRLYNSRDKKLYIGLYRYLQEFANTEGRDYKLEVEGDAYYGYPDAESTDDFSWVFDLPLWSNGKVITPNEHQVRAVSHTLRKKNTLLLSPTASGKSLIIYLAIRFLLDKMPPDKKILVVVPTTALVKQMQSDFAEYSTHDESFNADDETHIIYAGKEKFDISGRVVITTWQSAYELPNSWFDRFGAIFGDEAHTFKAKSLVSIMSNLRDAAYRVGTTGTLDGTAVSKLVLEGLFGIVYKVITTKNLIEQGILSDLKINILLLKHPPESCVQMKKADYQKELDFLVSNEKRNNFISNLALDQDGNTLVLFQFVEKHGAVLYDLIKESAHERRKVFFVSGSTDVDDRERIRGIVEKEKNAIIIASFGTFSTGINIRNIHNIIFGSPSKSQVRVLQSIGRGLRKSDDGRTTKLYDIADDLHYHTHKNHTLRHAGERISIYSRERFKFKIYEVNL